MTATKTDEPRDEFRPASRDARDFEPTNAMSMRGVAADLLADGERDARARVPEGDNEWRPDQAQMSAPADDDDAADPDAPADPADPDAPADPDPADPADPDADLPPGA